MLGRPAAATIPKIAIAVRISRRLCPRLRAGLVFVNVSIGGVGATEMPQVPRVSGRVGSRDSGRAVRGARQVRVAPPAPCGAPAVGDLMAAPSRTRCEYARFTRV